jgi:hypothetical protein
MEIFPRNDRPAAKMLAMSASYAISGLARVDKNLGGNMPNRDSRADQIEGYAWMQVFVYATCLIAAVLAIFAGQVMWGGIIGIAATTTFIVIYPIISGIARIIRLLEALLADKK